MAQAREPGSAPANHIKVARAGLAVLMRVSGLGNMSISLALGDFTSSSLQAGYRHFALDLADCTGMDSTFMGTIAGMSSQIKSRAGWMCLLNISGYNRKLLETVGVWKLVQVKENFSIAPVETECLLPGGDPDRRLEHIRQAHEKLVAIDERNRERFGKFLAALEEEMEGEKPGSDNPRQAEEL